MRIYLSPVRWDVEFAVVKTGDALTINGEVFDFSSLPDGATIPEGIVPCKFIIGPVERIDGEIHLTLILPHGPNPPQNVAFPQPITATADGPIELPHGEVETADVDA